MWNKYFIAATLQEALELLETSTNNSRIVAGATDLILEITRGLHPEVDTLIDISRIPGLNSITVDTKNTIHIGAMVTHAQAVSTEVIRKKATCLAEACWQVGSPQIRNRGTIAGNLLTASPANDTIPALMALDASVTLVSKSGTRCVKIEDLFTGVRKTVAQPGEILTEITIPQFTDCESSSFYKYALRNAQAISLVNCAIWLVRSQDNNIKAVRVAVGSVAPKVLRLRKLEQELISKNLNDLESLDFSTAQLEIRPITDIRASDKFRQAMVKTTIKRCLEVITDKEGHSLLPENPVTLSSIQTNDNMIDTNTYCIDDQHAIITKINGNEYCFKNSHQKTLLDLIRDDAGLIGTKEGCAEGECGACTIHLDGKAVMSCLIPAPRAHRAEITTIEGISDASRLHPVQQAFITEGAVQCGYCTPGFIMSAVKLLEERDNLDRRTIKEAVTGNLCRCTGYYKIISAIEKAALERG